MRGVFSTFSGASYSSISLPGMLSVVGDYGGGRARTTLARDGKQGKGSDQTTELRANQRMGRQRPSDHASRRFFERYSTAFRHTACIGVWAAIRAGQWQRYLLRLPMVRPQRVDGIRFFTGYDGTLDSRTPSRDDRGLAIRARDAYLHFRGRFRPGDFWSVPGPGVHPSRRPAWGVTEGAGADSVPAITL